MKKVLLVLVVLGGAFALDRLYDYRLPKSSRPYKDYWGNSYKHYDNLWKDTDRDGVMNYYDYNDRNPNIWTPYQKGYKNWDW
ncbi:hypothetical protein Hydth_0521 [Hydrogenobacter thermophilus TK-6]|nr:hypothetical protein [Hydrogenobacter thermophilus]ADO44921.1 hypothetical protein Hydth_0521 [Hydrogenobacter thermophilus TK-6]